MAIKYSDVHRQNVLSQLNTDIGATAKLRIYAGTRPANADAAIGGATLLVELACGATFGTVGGGGAGIARTLTANAITSANATDTGTAAWFRIWKSDGTTPVIDGDVAMSGSDCNLNNTSIASGQNVSVTSLVLTGANQ